MTEESLSKGVPQAGNLPPRAFPLKDKPDTFLISDRTFGSVEVGPDFIFGRGFELTEAERRRALQYLWARDGLVCQYDKAPLQLRDDTKLPTTDIHHSRRLANGKRLHQAKYMAMVCHDHNAVYGEAPWSSIAGERESARHAPTGGAKEVSTEIDLNVRLFPRYERWLDENLKVANGIPLSEAIFTATREIRKEVGHGAHQTIRGYLQVLTEGSDAPYYVDAESKRVHRRSSRKEQQDNSGIIRTE